MATAGDPLASPFGACPVPKSNYDHILLGHGSGGQLTNDLIRRLFVPAFDNEVLAAQEDQALLSIKCGRAASSNSPSELRLAETEFNLAFTTDSFVVRPIFF